MNSAWLDAGLLGRVRRIVRAWPCCLVGGAVRDHLLDRTPHDLDLVTAGGDEPAIALARELPARLVPIGGDRFAATRLVGDGFVIDLWDRGEMTLDDELARRDLTINALAIDLADGTLHDPFGGRSDLEARRLSATTDESFADDPLRILRLARLAAELPDFTVELRTTELAAASLAALRQVAVERRREEFSRALRAQSPRRALDVWIAVGFYPGLVHSKDASAASAAASAFDRARSLGQWFSNRANSLGLDGVHPLDPLILHAALLLDAAQADVSILLESGHASRREARDIALVMEHRGVPEGPAAQRWLLHSTAHVWPTALVFASAADTDTASSAVKHLIEQCLERVRNESESIFDPPPLLRGDEIRQLLDLPPGPEIGLASRRLRRRQIEGRLVDREEAVAWLASERRSSTAD